MGALIQIGFLQEIGISVNVPIRQEEG